MIIMNNSLNIVNFTELENVDSKKLTHRVLDHLQKYKFFEFDNNNQKFRLEYVGLLISDNTLIRVYPKYIQNNKYSENDFKETLKVIKKFKKKNGDLDHEIDNNENISFNIISIMIYLLEDYYENGIYTNFQNLVKINGTGEINWDKTINNNYPIIENNKPYYTEIYTNYKINDIYDYFHLLHECILTECAKKLNDFDLLEVFDLAHVNLSEKSLEDFGDSDFIVAKIENELNVQFNSQKQKILKFMKSYVSNKNLFSDKNSLILYGVKKYEHIWEELCSDAFDSKLKTELDKLILPKPLNDKYKSFKSMHDIIGTPKWILNDENKEKNAKLNKLKLDLIVIHNNTFIIFDAKYYDLIFEKKKKISGQPGIHDIAKQYLYQIALNEFIKDHCFEYIVNALLFPKYEGEIENKGIVKLDMFKCLNKIQVIMLPANKLNKLYLCGDEKEKLEFKLDLLNKLEKSKLNNEKYLC